MTAGVSRSRDAHVVVLAGGDLVGADALTGLPAADLVIAADGGFGLGAILGVEVDLIVGDLDSIGVEDLARAETAGVRIDRHPVDKDRTDLAIAIDTAIDLGAASITVIGGAGGRMDHFLANALLLAAPRPAPPAIQLRSSHGTITVIRDETTLRGAPGDLVSLLAAHGRAEGVTTTGLVFTLDDEPLEPGSSRGVSNQLAATEAFVQVRVGTLLAVQPAEDPGLPDHHSQNSRRGSVT